MSQDRLDEVLVLLRRESDTRVYGLLCEWLELHLEAVLEQLSLEQLDAGRVMYLQRRAVMFRWMLSELEVGGQDEG
ncbi:MAG: hypothetical protein JAY71_19330 [Candidatus Thiodiazotropha weberae]|nr:hypothetical protein [Candidatus Thiodiazotropha weberae]